MDIKNIIVEGLILGKGGRFRQAVETMIESDSMIAGITPQQRGALYRQVSNAMRQDSNEGKAQALIDGFTSDLSQIIPEATALSTEQKQAALNFIDGIVGNEKKRLMYKGLVSDIQALIRLNALTAAEATAFTAADVAYELDLNWEVS